MAFSGSKINSLPNKPGVYSFISSSGEVLYIGKSLDVRARVRAHSASLDPKIKTLVQKTDRVEVIPVRFELEALLLEASLIKKHAPRYNSRAKDDKKPLYIKITIKEGFPKVATSRLEDDPRAVYFGPFPSSGTVKEVLRQTRKIFPYCAQKDTKRVCLYSHLGLCDPCPAFILRQEPKLRGELEKKYRQNIKNLVALLQGKDRALAKRLEKQMKKAADQDDFEQAARLRDQLRRLEYITRPYETPAAYIENPELADQLLKREAEDLQKILSRKIDLKNVPERIECFDVSHLGGQLTTASMVTFVGAEPDKNLYRRFKIRGKARGDDTAAMAEVIKRRMGHLEDWGKPDLIIVDGGKPQLSAARTAIGELGIKIPVIGLAKREEEIYTVDEGGFSVLRLPQDSPALQLVQRIRDEAHRTARGYHLKLRIREMHNN